MSTRRVLFVAYYFPPIAGAGVQRTVKFVRYLPEFGYEPVVLTGPGVVGDRWSPADETLRAEIPDVEVHRVPGPEPALATGWRRRAERVLDMRSDFARWWQDGVVERGRTVGRSTDVVLGELVPYLTAEPVARLSRDSSLPWVADLQDPWALDEMWLYPTGLHRRRDLRRMRRVLGTADAVIMNTPEARSRVERRFPELAPRLPHAIPNGVDLSDFPDEPLPPRDGKFRIVHSGYLHTEHGFEHRRTRRVRELLGGTPVKGMDLVPRSHVFLLEAVDLVLSRQPELAHTVEVHLAGLLSETDRKIAARSRVAHLHGYLTHEKTIELQRSAALLFLPMHDLPKGTRAGLVPGKTYEYLGVGRPILAAVPAGDARDILTEAGNALVCDPSDVNTMSDLIAGEIARWREGRPTSGPRREIVARYERRAQASALASVLDEVLARRGGGRGRGEPHAGAAATLAGEQ